MGGRLAGKDQPTLLNALEERVVVGVSRTSLLVGVVSKDLSSV
jgi:hypothetical protein